jgi:chromosome segregation ATPase
MAMADEEELRALLHAINERLEHMDGRLARVESRLERMESRLERRVDAIPVLLPSVRDRLAILDALVRGQGATLARIEDTISMDLLERIRKLERN